ncbi:hypothetical protein Tco_1242000, partial [Tanacetum coccineum]
NYAVLQSIPCSPECKIVGLILLDHCLSHALTSTADVLAVYLQQFWRMVSKVQVDQKMWCQRMPQQMWCRSISGVVGKKSDVASLFRNGTTVPSTLICE